MTAGPGGAAPTAISDHFRSVDSAPAGISVNRPPSAANGFLVTFAGLCIVAMLVMTYLVHTGVTDKHDLILLGEDRGDVAVPTRLFVVVFFVTYAAYAYTNGWRRLWIGASLIGKFAAVSIGFDVLAWLLHSVQLVSLPPFAQQLASALVALAILPHTILRQARLPSRDTSATSPYTPAGAYVCLVLCLVVAVIAAVVAVEVFFRAVVDLRQWALLGGIGPGVFLVQQVFAASTALFGWRAVRRSRRARFAPPVAVLVPAHNEAHDIADTIAAVDRAAESYRGTVRLYVVDNASTDGTTGAAERAIAACATITGEVLKCPTPGKAVALNLGIARISEEFVVRIDADTVIGPGCIRTAMSHFADPRVGSVGGMPLPAEEKTWIDKVRLVEVYLRHGFFQVSLDGYRGVLGVPGMFAIYRRSAVVAVGGMVQGMNGEDTDICIRLGSAGFYTVADPKAVYYSETPRTYAHLREQRTRWFRSIYHIAAHNRGSLLDRRSMTGAFVLPFQLVNAARRAMLAPLLLFAVIAFAGFRATFTELQWQPVVATVLGMPLIMTVFVCLLWSPRALRYVPAYLCFRVLRSYFTLAAALSLVFPPMRPRTRLPRVLIRGG
ncbi:glycosyltransferase [Tomitella fengzijianii]|uniref:Glycosyltransferase n=1 Tax=Tomitella fengzijianii TaxID=2597660 RepID=A0A516X678_9ACTN|nr:glycosyltransferase family 2 protein [Tomitella fengzijianii]QDQ98577.1 glycosyltransferase [Tomitella fengzijianii]